MKVYIKNMLNMIYDLLMVMGMAIVYITEAIVLTFIPRRYRGKSIKGEVALVTGGAGGIGKLIAAKLANLGCNVVIWDINKIGMYLKLKGFHLLFYSISFNSYFFNSAKRIIAK